MGGGSSKPDVSQPVTVTTAEAATKAREQQLSLLKRQGMQSTLLTQESGGNSSPVGTGSLLGGQ